ncbi:DUF2827 family protein [Caviibacterium pharyngocola]|uniref:DUF2827 domain-containing protein n=1 Tax=Caviibacterium pharyngocola TaxID=28159 RepID=A0A2M8RXV3_9PAST|nr:DUF2827 family protein [Caviibacterium pharyngocola]PJG83723.1 DUF2827 domain-containing protein [Caviibacterium pharyngocola]
MARKYKLGITFNLETDVADIWSNGIHQNLVFLYQLFQHSSLVEDVTFVSWGPKNTTVPAAGFMLDGLDLKFATFDEVADELDVLIEGGLLLTPDHARRIHDKGGKVVSYKMGNDYIMDVETTIFARTPQRVLNGTVFDRIWTLPHHENTNRSYLSIMNRCPLHVVPYIWAPTFCDMVIKNIKEKHNIDFGYKPNGESVGKRISSFEPNIFIFKNSFIPVLICEQAYRTAPEKIKHAYMCNTYKIKDHKTFFNFIGRTNIVRDGIMTVEKRYQMPDFLGRYTDIVVAHQWENGLNNAFNDILYGGYPFIHNSTLLPKGVGYYYDQFDAFEGAKVLLDVIDNHDKNHHQYTKRANEYLDSLHPTNPVNIYYYEKELKRLFEDD